LFIAGAALLINQKARMAAASIGLLMAILTLLLYVPILAIASQTAQVLEGINYVADTLLYAGAALLVAGALPEDAPLGRGSRAT
jgi:ABC-type long-subunit fatty acid transport system fused permease/ATPase subunit